MEFTSNELYEITYLIDCETKVLLSRINKAETEELENEYIKMLNDKENLKKKAFIIFQNKLKEEISK